MTAKTAAEPTTRSGTAPAPAMEVQIDLHGIPLPDGVRFRRWRGLDADLPAMWAASDAARVADGELERSSYEGTAAYYRHLERCDLDRDLVLAEEDGRVVGYARVEWNDTNDGERWYEGVGIVHPEVRGRGIGSALHVWTERRRLEIAREHAAAGDRMDRARWLTTFLFDGDTGGRTLLTKAGYEPFRRFATMSRPTLEGIESHELPAGIEIRPIPRDLEVMRRVFRADNEAFRDHFGWTDDSDERFAEFVEDPTVDPDLWIVAFDGDEVAGGILNGIHQVPGGSPEGWLDSVFVRRPWRRRGLARALIARSLELLRSRGLSSASLGVDLANPNQALGLYESCGFRAVSARDRVSQALAAVARRPTGGGPAMIDQRIHLPDAPEIAGLVARPFDPGRDYPSLADLISTAHRADGVESFFTSEDLRALYEHQAEFDPRRDVLLVEVDGSLVAAAETSVRTRDGIAVHVVEGWVRPDHRRRGLGRALLHWTERRAAEVARVDGRTGERVTSAWPDADQTGAIALYEGEGYEVVRYGFMMLRDLSDPIPDRALPAGLEVRPVVTADHRRIWEADTEAFQDHWGRAEPLESDYERWFAIPGNDPARWQVAWDGDEVAGSVMPFVFEEENETLGLSRGWLEHISVRRPWRRRGLASALIVRALRELRERGLAEAALGVDAENLTGAVSLYENLGFRRARTGVTYRKAFVVDPAE